MTPARASVSGLERVPPQSLETERAALAAMLLGNDASREAIARMVSRVQVRDFYRTGHQKLYSAIRDLFEKGEKVDMITVTEWLRKNEALEVAGGHSYVAGLVDEIPLVANIDDYARIISEKSVMRRLMEVGSDLFGRASEDAIGADDLVNTVSQVLYEIAQNRFSGGMQKINTLVMQEIEKVERLASRQDGSMITGLSWGFPILDQLTSGLHPGELVVLAARPGMGKTSLALNVAESVGLRRQVPVLIFSLEMSAQALVRRLLCSHARVDSQSVRRGQLFGEDRARIMQAFGVLNDLPLWIDESSRLTPIELRARARRVLGEAHAAEGEGLIIVDYMQMMDCYIEGSGNRPENRQQEITAISRSLKAVAKELKMPVLVLSQLSRAPERRGDDARPRLSDLRESGAIEQDADVVIFIYRDRKDQSDQAQGEIEQGWVTRLSVAKQRNGPTGAFRLFFNRQYTRFDLLADGQLVAEDE